MMRMGLALVLMAGTARAGEWVPLAGQALHDALAARTLAFPEGRFGFGQDGLLLFDPDSGAEVWGAWRVDEALLCFTLPPAAEECGPVARQGIDLRLDGTGGPRIGRYVDL